MNELINITAVLLMLAVMGAQGYMLGSLLMRKLLEWHDVYQIRKIPNLLMAEFGYCGSFSKRVTESSIESAKKWERG